MRMVRSQALLDEAGLLTAMVYVDLNPIRAGIAPTPEASEFTSIEARIRAIASSPSKEAREARIQAREKSAVPLMAFKDSHGGGLTIPYASLEYLELVDWSARIVRADKPGAMSVRLPTLMHRLNVDADAWQSAMRPSGNVFGRALGNLDHLRLHAQALKQSWVRGQGAASRLYPATKNT